MASHLQKPGVYISEISAFPSTVVAVPTAIAAFVGYTPRAHPSLNQPVRINSVADFLHHFGAVAAPGVPAPEEAQYSPLYFTTPASNPATANLVLGGRPFDVQPDPGTVYYLYQSIRLFFANGGHACYVVSVGTYGPATGQPHSPSAPLVNPNVSAAALVAGLAALATVPDAALIAIPDAALLSAADNQTVLQAILAHCGTLESRFALLDVPGGFSPDLNTWMDGIASFRASVGSQFLSFGAAYYPFLRTTVSTDSALNFTNLGGAETLAAILPDATQPPVSRLLAQIGKPSGPDVPGPTQIEVALRTASTAYRQLQAFLLQQINTLPPSGVLAGVYSRLDFTQGVAIAPANVGLISVNDTTLLLTESLQASLAIEAVSGKSINAIRNFPGRGVLVWGARTLDGNSLDWRYVHTRRTVIMISQSLKLALANYALQPNTAATWANVTSAFSDFLKMCWDQGMFAGGSWKDAYSVSVGLGTTMTVQDVLDGTMIVHVQMMISADLIRLVLRQTMQRS